MARLALAVVDALEGRGEEALEVFAALMADLGREWR
jgi:thioredoxin-like negative regulator of GroEL